MFVKSTEKFLEAFEKSFSSKYEVLSEYSNPILSFILSTFFELKLFFFHNLLETFLWTLRICWRYLKKSAWPSSLCQKKIATTRQTNQIICKETWKKMRVWKSEAQNVAGIFWQNLMFWAETFTKRPLENFLWASRTYSRYLKGVPNLDLCVSKKIVTVRHTNTKILTKKREKNWFCETSFGTTVGTSQTYFSAWLRHVEALSHSTVSSF